MSDETFYKCDDGVCCNTTEGSVEVKYSNIQFIKVDCQVPLFDIKINDIKLQRISPPTSKKVQLQIILNTDGQTYTFHFNNKQENREIDLSRREEMKSVLAKLLPLNRENASSNKNILNSNQSTNNDSTQQNNINQPNKNENNYKQLSLLSLEEKKKLLMTNKSLYQMYKEFVATKIIDADDFWRYLAIEPRIDANNQQQRPGLESNFWATLVPETKGCNELVFSLSKEKIQAIFATYPSLKALYQKNIPAKMSQDEFWKLFLQSQFFNKDNTKEMKDARAFFQDALKNDLIENSKNNSQKSLTNNLNDFQQSYTIPRNYESDIFSSVDTATNEHIQLFNKCNLHSKTILDLSQKRDNIQENNYRKRKFEIADVDAVEYSNEDIIDGIVFDDLNNNLVNDQLLSIGEDDISINLNFIPSFFTVDNNHLDEDKDIDGEITEEDVNCFTRSLDSFYDNPISIKSLNKTNTNDPSLPQTHNFHSPTIDSNLKNTIWVSYQFINKLIDRMWFHLTKRYSCSEKELAVLLKCLAEYRSKNLKKFIQSPSLRPMVEHLTKMIDSVLYKYQFIQQFSKNNTDHNN